MFNGGVERNKQWCWSSEARALGPGATARRRGHARVPVRFVDTDRARDRLWSVYAQCTSWNQAQPVKFENQVKE